METNDSNAAVPAYGYDERWPRVAHDRFDLIAVEGTRFSVGKESLKRWS